MDSWKPIPEYEDTYEISSFGTVRRLKDCTRAPAGFIMKPTITRDGYAHVGLSRNGRQKTCNSIHRLVWEAHVGPIPNDYVINHKNGIKTDNRLSNLECVTNSENIRHAFRELGRRRGGEKLNKKSVIMIRRRRARGETLTSIAKRYGVTPSCVISVASGRTWPHVGGPLTQPKTRHQNGRDVTNKITDAVVRETILRYRQGESPTALAKELKVDKVTIHNWAKGRSRPRILASL